ncbi:ATP-binding protein [Macrococcoides canis]|uniref:ATP-binding protein n=1 Tax=Macrococcoides canis TaxID=1855823 RepID=UPI0010FBC48D|nr:ATP-binding protein [Macrococcus canis]QCT74148.1 ATP-binding protein [Macrococcus canis]
MSNKRINESKELRKMAEHLLVDKELNIRGRDELDKSVHNMNNLIDTVNEQIDAKKDLLKDLRKLRNNNASINQYQNVQNKINFSKEVLNKNRSFIKNERINTINIDDANFMSQQYTRDFARENNISLENPFFDLYSQTEKIEFSQKIIEKFDLLTLDNVDYGFAICSALIAGLVDVVFLGTIKGGKNADGLQEKVDLLYEKVIIKYSEFQRTADMKEHLEKAKSYEDKIKIKQKIKEIKEEDIGIQQAIKYFEKKHKVSYDAPLDKNVPGMKINNHHNASLSHDLSPLGLIFGIIDQITGKSTFIDPDTGKLVRIVTENTNNKLEGNIFRKIIQAINNWFGHCISDIAGSSTSKGRGMGLPAPFWPYLQKLNFGKIQLNDKKDSMTIGQVSTWMYEQGYDHRAFTAELIPVVIFETLLRCYWFYKQYFYFGKTFKETIASFKSREFSRLLLVATSTFTTIDVTHAVIKSGGLHDLGTFILTVNKPGLMDLGFRSVQNLRNEIKHRNHVESVLEHDILMEYKRVTQEIKVFE